MDTEAANKEIGQGTREVSQTTTREIILTAAERMFAEHGISGISLRAIISEAGVNTAAVHYHFGSKDKLIEEVFLHRAGLIAEERLRLLEEALNAPPGRPRLVAVVHAFLRPGLLGGADSAEAARCYARFRAKLLAENSEFVRGLMSRSFDGSTRQFVQALADILPGLSRDELLWRMHAMLGIMVYTMTDAGRITSISEGDCDPSDHSAALERLVPIAVDLFSPGLLPEQS